MSARSGNTLRFCGIVMLCVVMAACGMSDTRPTESARGTVPQPPAVPSAPGESAPPAEIPSDAAASYARALSAMDAGDWLEAELELEQLVLLYPEYPGTWVNLAIIYRQDGRPEEAVEALTKATAIAPNHAVANNELGAIIRERGDFAAAEAAYRRAILGDPGYALPHYNLGVLLDLYLKREAEALEHYVAYQRLLAEPDAEVGRWIVDLRRRLGITEETARIAQEDGP